MTPMPFSHDQMKEHWETVYGSRAPTELSWYQPKPTQSLALLEQLGVASSAIIDVGGGASTLVDALLDRGAGNITVLDISRAALDLTRARLGARAASVEWIEGDITRVQLSDIPEVDSLYFTLLNHNKRSITVDAKNPKGKQVLEALVKQCDVLARATTSGTIAPSFTFSPIPTIGAAMWPRRVRRSDRAAPRSSRPSRRRDLSAAADSR